jgi:phospholipase/lecithinase/hemolysin
VTPYAPTVLSLVDQVQTQFVPRYGSRPNDASWTSKDSLFAFFFGINDVGNSWWLNNATLYDAIFTRYTGQLDQLYKTGARNFLFLSVPPVQLAPLTLNKDDGGYSVENEGKVILDWNKRLSAMTAAFKKSHTEANLFVHDTYKVYDDVIKSPKAWPQTSGLKNVTGYCAAYAK